MATGSRRTSAEQVNRLRTPDLEGDPLRPHVLPRQIDVAWASISEDDILPGELVFNRDDNSLVLRKDHTNIYRFDNAATRAV